MSICIHEDRCIGCGRGTEACPGNLILLQDGPSGRKARAQGLSRPRATSVTRSGPASLGYTMPVAAAFGASVLPAASAPTTSATRS